MSNRPKIYASCKAGCLWETVHKDEFLQSASIVKLSAAEGAYRLTPFTTYKAKNSTASNGWGFTLKVNYTICNSNNPSASGQTYTEAVTLPAFDKYADGLDIRILDLSIDTNSSPLRVSVICEFNGERSTIFLSSKDIPLPLLYEYTLINYAIVEGATDCWYYNKNAQIEFVSETGGGGGIDENTEQRITTLETKVLTLESKTATLESKTAIIEGKVNSITLGFHTDGLLYIFVNGTPVGGGITLPEGASGDITGNFDSDGNLILTGDIPDGTYVGYITKSGNSIRIGDVDLYCTVKNNLTYCTNSNEATSVENGSAYSATITANSGYTLKTVTATMGGSAVSVNGGTINIAKVTGDIVITAVAEEIPVAEPVTVNIGLTDNYAIDTNGNLRGSQSPGYATTDFIDVTNIPKPCTIHLTGAQWITQVESGYVRFFVADKSGNKILGGNTMMKYIPDGMTAVSNNTNSDDVTFTITSNNIGKLRFTGLYGTGNGYTGTGDFNVITATLTYTPNS